jgi:hypothetical protein
VKSAFVAILFSFLLTLYLVFWSCWRDDAISDYIKSRIAVVFRVHRDFSDFGIPNTLGTPSVWRSQGIRPTRTAGTHLSMREPKVLGLGRAVGAPFGPSSRQPLQNLQDIDEIPVSGFSPHLSELRVIMGILNLSARNSLKTERV